MTSGPVGGCAMLRRDEARRIAAVVVIGAMIVGALVLYLVTRGLLLVLLEMRPWSIEEMIG